MLHDNFNNIYIMYIIRVYIIVNKKTYIIITAIQVKYKYKYESMRCTLVYLDLEYDFR